MTSNKLIRLLRVFTITSLLTLAGASQVLAQPSNPPNNMEVQENTVGSDTTGTNNTSEGTTVMGISSVGEEADGLYRVVLEASQVIEAGKSKQEHQTNQANQEINYKEPAEQIQEATKTTSKVIEAGKGQSIEDIGRTDQAEQQQEAQREETKQEEAQHEEAKEPEVIEEIPEEVVEKVDEISEEEAVEVVDEYDAPQETEGQTQESESQPTQESDRTGDHVIDMSYTVAENGVINLPLGVLDGDTERANAYGMEEYLSLHDFDSSLTQEAQHGEQVIPEFTYAPGASLTATYYQEGINGAKWSGFRRGDLFLRNDGNLYVLYEDGTVAVNGTAGGYTVDSEGKVYNEFTRIGHKYIDQWNNDDYMMYFDSKNDAFAWTQFVQTLGADNQDARISFHWADGKYAINKNDYEQLAKPNEQTNDGLTVLVNEITNNIKTRVEEAGWDTIPESWLIAEISRQVCHTISYDYDMYKTMQSAVTDRSGVCYHQSRVAKAVLDNLGYDAEYEIGYTRGTLAAGTNYNTVNGNHIWLAVQSRDGNRVTRIDPTSGLCIQGSTYLNCYTTSINQLSRLSTTYYN